MSRFFGSPQVQLIGWSGLDLPKNPQERPILGSKLGRCNLDNSAMLHIQHCSKNGQFHSKYYHTSTSHLGYMSAMKPCCSVVASHSSHRVRKIMSQLVVAYKVRKSLAIPSPPNKLQMERNRKCVVNKILHLKFVGFP